MTAELNNKKAAKFDADRALEVFKWMEDVLRHGGNGDAADVLQAATTSKAGEVAKPLKDGVILCQLVNVLSPNAVKKINESKMAFKMMENINNFLTACEKLGCRKDDMFQTVDLYEAENIPQFINGIYAVGRKAHKIAGYDGPTLGTVESEQNKREFSEEQLKAGENVIGLQMGTNKCASQAGQNFGKSRAIID